MTRSKEGVRVEERSRQRGQHEQRPAGDRATHPQGAA